MDVIQHLCPESRIGRAVTRGMRALLVGCMLFCVTIALHTQITTLLPEFVREPSLPPEEEEPLWFLKPTAVVHLLFSVWTYVQLIAHFVAACTQPASRIRPPPPSPPTVNGEAGAGASAATTGRALKAQQLAYGADGTATFCAQCQVPKLLRTHHCKICGVCVELMDHREHTHAHTNAHRLGTRVAIPSATSHHPTERALMLTSTRIVWNVFVYMCRLPFHG